MICGLGIAWPFVLLDDLRLLVERRRELLLRELLRRAARLDRLAEPEPRLLRLEGLRLLLELARARARGRAHRAVAADRRVRARGHLHLGAHLAGALRLLHLLPLVRLGLGLAD